MGFIRGSSWGFPFVDLLVVVPSTLLLIVVLFSLLVGAGSVPTRIISPVTSTIMLPSPQAR